MQLKSTMAYSELITCLRKKFARKNTTSVSSGILLFMSGLSSGLHTPCLILQWKKVFASR